MLVIGLTGGIGSGKSMVANLFAKLNVPIIDTDVLAREVTETGKPALDDIRQHFGPQVFNSDGSLHRAKLRELIFADANNRKWLEKLLHPLIIARTLAKLTELRAPYVIVVIPLLLESEPLQFIDRVLVVDASEENQIKRTTARDNTHENTVKAIMQSQVKRQERLQHADDIILNDGLPEHLEHQVQQLHQTYSQLSQGS